MNMLQNIDNSILQFIQRYMRSSILDVMMPIVTSLGNGLTIWTLIGVALIVSKKYRKYGAMMVFSLILCFIVGNLGLKPLIARVRPFEAIPLLEHLLIQQPTSSSFPSGHAMCSFSASSIIFYMNKKIGICALILSSIIGFSRLYLYVHYPSDVLAGMIIGTLLGSLTVIIFKSIGKARS